jgi:glycogen phosphorylase
MTDVVQNPDTTPQERSRTGLSADALRRGIIDHLRYSIGRPAAALRPEHYYRATALAVRDRIQDNRVASTQTSLDLGRKVTCYLSAEFLMGPQLGSNLLNLGIEDAARQALASLGQDLDSVLACEEEPGLGNGGLGRLAACYLDSLATLERPAIGYGIRYEFGIFDQEIHDGWQVEKTDNWLVNGNPWEIAKPDVNYLVKWGGYAEHYTDDAGHDRVRWVPGRVLKGVAYDTPIQGYNVNTCNVLTLWSARAVQSLALDAFNTGDYYKAVEDEVNSETVTKVLYPNDEPEAGKRLRLLQQYFFVLCSLEHVLHIMDDLADASVRDLPQRFALQLNDTHPSIGVAELMRILVDERQLDWDEAWAITVASFGYTNHTLLPEALETWPLAMFAESLPRHLEIIYEINRRFLDEVRAKFPGDDDRLRRMSIIGEDGGKSVRMAHLATVGSHAINGVAALHSELLKDSVLKDFYELWPERFSNKTNGVTPRRFLAMSNPGLRELPAASKLGDRVEIRWRLPVTRKVGIALSLVGGQFQLCPRVRLAAEPRGKLAPVHFPDASAGQLVDEMNLARCGRRRQRRRDVRAQLGQRGCRTPGAYHDRRDHSLAQSFVGDAEHCGLGHRGMGRQRRLHQLGQHRQPAGADRIVDPAQHPQYARIINGANVVGVKPARLRERIRMHWIAVTLRQRRTAEQHPAVV